MKKKQNKIDTPMINIENEQLLSHSKDSEYSKSGYKERELTDSRKNMKR